MQRIDDEPVERRHADTAVVRQVPFLPAVAAARLQGELIRDIVGHVRVTGPGLDIERAVELDTQRISIVEDIEADVVFDPDMLVEIEQSGDRMQVIGLYVRLQLLRELMFENRLPVVRAAPERSRLGERIAEIGGHIEIVKEDRLEVAIAGERLERDCVAGIEIDDASEGPLIAVVDRVEVGIEVALLVREGRTVALAESAEAVIGRIGVGQHTRKRDLAELDRERVVVLLVIFAGEEDRQILRRQELEVGAGRELFGVVDIGAGQYVLAIAVAVNDLHREASTDALRQRTANRTLADQVEVGPTDSHTGIAVQVIGRLGGDEIDCAACRITPVQSALRPAQHLDPFEVEHRAELRLSERHHHAIDVQGDGGIDAGQRARQADAADEQLCEIEVVAEGHARDELLQRLDIAAVGFDQLVFADRGHRERDVGQRLFALLGGDDDGLLVGRTCLGLGYRNAWREYACCEQSRGGGQ